MHTAQKDKHSNYRPAFRGVHVVLDVALAGVDVDSTPVHLLSGLYTWS